MFSCKNKITDVNGVNNENVLSSLLPMWSSSPEVTPVNLLYIVLGQCYPIDLSAVKGMFYICANIVAATSHIWLSST